MVKAKYSRALPVIQIEWRRFGEDLRRIREKRGLSIRQFEAITGVLYTTIARVERNQNPCGSEAFLTLVDAMGKEPANYTIRRPRRFAEWIAQAGLDDT